MRQELLRTVANLKYSKLISNTSTSQGEGGSQYPTTLSTSKVSAGESLAAPVSTTTQVENQTDGYLFKVDELETTDSFIAESNDAYLLNVTSPHSVIPLELTNIHRSAIVLQTNRFTFDEVLEMLKETDNV